MAYIDFHCHLDYKDFDNDREKLIFEMKKNHIIALTNTTNQQEYLKAKELFQNYDNIYVCPGLYPQEAEKMTDDKFEKYLKLIKKDKDKIKVIGEVGLDRHHTTDPQLWQIQEKRFRRIIELAIKINKPLCIHTRKAEKEVLDIIEEYVKKTGFTKFNLHCFMGKKNLINKIKELNIYCSIPLILLNNESFQNLVRELSVRQLLVETDSPFLNPDKTRNSPLNIPLIYAKIAEIKGYDKDEIKNIIYNSYMKLTM